MSAFRNTRTPHARGGNAAPASDAGFTLVEVLVVVVILAALAAVAFPSMFGVKSSAYKNEVIATAEAYQSAIEVFRAQHNGRPPIDILNTPAPPQQPEWDASGPKNTRTGQALLRTGTPVGVKAGRIGMQVGPGGPGLGWISTQAGSMGHLIYVRQGAQRNNYALGVRFRPTKNAPWKTLCIMTPGPQIGGAPQRCK